jgi:hypothetical protein
MLGWQIACVICPVPLTPAAFAPYQPRGQNGRGQGAVLDLGQQRFDQQNAR